jgi:hypothetical protein
MLIPALVVAALGMAATMVLGSPAGMVPALRGRLPLRSSGITVPIC